MAGDDPDRGRGRGDHKVADENDIQIYSEECNGMKERLIEAEAFKKYCRRGYKNTEREFRSGTLRAFARQITEDFCKDIDEQPTVEAIPTDWIREQAQEYPGMESAMWDKLLRLWEKEKTQRELYGGDEQ